MHQTETGYHFESVNVELQFHAKFSESSFQSSPETYPGIHENKVHLHKSENHLQNWIDTAQNHVARRVEGYFKKYTKLQTVVDHRTQTKRCKNYRNIMEQTERMLRHYDVI